MYVPIDSVMSHEKRDNTYPLLGNADTRDEDPIPEIHEEWSPSSSDAQGWRKAIHCHYLFLGVAYGLLCFLCLGLFYGWLSSSHNVDNARADCHELFPCKLRVMTSFFSGFTG